MPKPKPTGAFIEIVEYAGSAFTGDPDLAGEVIIPNDVRINGQSLYCDADSPVIVHEMSTNPLGAVKVTLTLLAKRVEIKREGGGEDA